MNTKTIYIILAIVLVGALSYYFLSQPATNQLPASDDANSSVSDEAQDDSSDVIENLQNQINDLQEQLSSKDQQSGSSVSNSNDYETYTNSEFGISFDYPNSYKVTRDEEGLGGWRISLERIDDSSTIMLVINPDGFGPIWANIKYYLSYDYGTLSIVNRTIQECEYCDDENKDSVVASIQTNKDSYFFNSSWPRSGASREQDTKTVIESFKF